MLPQKSNKENGLDAPKILQELPLPRSGSGGAAAFQAELNCLVVGSPWKEVVPSKSGVPNPSSQCLWWYQHFPGFLISAGCYLWGSSEHLTGIWELISAPPPHK